MKNLFIFLLYFVLSSNVFADNNQGISYYVKNFYTNSQYGVNGSIQDDTKANNSCGPTSLLFIKSHYAIETNGVCYTYIGNTTETITELKKIYSSISQNFNTTTSLDVLKTYVKNNWGYKTVIRMSSTSGINNNVNNLINYLNNNTLALIVLKPTATVNPVYGWQHIVIVYAYYKKPDSKGNTALSPQNIRDNDEIYFFDPYYGGTNHFKRSEISSVVDLAGFAFLAIGK